MLAGAHGIDLVLFTVAADDGVMPQTEEHLDIVHLLGIKLALFVITKADLVSPARIADIEEEIDILTLGTTLENSPKITVSSVTGQGISELKDRIAELLKSHATKQRRTVTSACPSTAPSYCKGMASSSPAHALSGEVKVGEQVRCLPGDYLFRVRSLQVHGKPVDSGGMGTAGGDQSHRSRARLDRARSGDLSREADADFGSFRCISGSAAGSGQGHQKSSASAHSSSAPRNGSAKLSLLGNAEKSSPKQSAYCQIMLNEPLLVLRGDHFIVRDETARRTFGGRAGDQSLGETPQTGDRELSNRLEALHRGDVASAHSSLYRRQRIVRGADRRDSSISQHQGRTDARCHRHDETAASLECGRRKSLHHRTKWRRINRTNRPVVQRIFTPVIRSCPGWTWKSCAASWFMNCPRRFSACSSTLMIEEKLIAKEDNLLRLASHRVQLGGQKKTLMDKIKKLLGEQPLAPPDLKEIEKQAGVPRRV